MQKNRLAQTTLLYFGKYRGCLLGWLLGLYIYTQFSCAIILPHPDLAEKSLSVGEERGAEAYWDGFGDIDLPYPIPLDLEYQFWNV